MSSPDQLHQPLSTSATSETILKCDSCGLESAWEEAFHKSFRSFRRDRLHNYCPRCWAKWELAVARWQVLSVVAIGVSCATLVSIFPSFKLGWFYLNLAVWYAFLLVLIIPHEAGHALVGWLLGGHVFCVEIGVGRPIWRTNVGRIAIVFNSIPVIGLTHVGFPSRRWLRFRQILFVLAGPLANAVLLAIGLHFGWGDPLFNLPGPFFDRHADLELYAGPAFVLANACILLSSLVPYRMSVRGQLQNSDGMSLVQIPFLSSGDIQQTIAFYFFMESAYCLQEKAVDQALHWSERGLEQFPDSHLLQMCRAGALFRLREFAKSRQICLDLGEISARESAFRLWRLDWIASMDLLMGGDVRLAEAEGYSAEVFRLAPWEDSYRTTRGCVLIELGKIDEGMAFLKQVLRERADGPSQAWCASYLALAEVRRGDQLESSRYLEAARRADSTCPVIETVEKKIAAENV